MELGDFEGLWQFTRHVANGMGPDAEVTGTVRFVPCADGLQLIEEGEMRLPGQAPMRAARRYHWTAADQGIDVFFDDGRYFHRIDAGLQVAGHHDCPPDLYDVAYDFSAWPVWQAVWTVRGPRKSYVMTTDYVRSSV